MKKKVNNLNQNYKKPWSSYFFRLVNQSLLQYKSEDSNMY